MGSLLFDEYPIIVLPELACAVGLNEAIVLQQIHYWTELNRKNKKNYHEGRYWAYNSFHDWQKQFPWWSEVTVKRIFGKLENDGVLLSGVFNKAGFDRTKWYCIDYERLAEKCPSYQFDTMDSIRMIRPIPETNQRLTL